LVAVSGEAGRVTFGEVLAVGEFRAMWLAELLSFMGDQFARVALAVLVFDRTGSAALTGLTYALTFVPTVVGALTLSGIADRRSRRSVIVMVDGVRALVVAAMVIPGIGLPWLCVLVTAMSFLGGCYKAAQLALLRDVLSAERFPAGMALRQVTTQAAQLAGFAVGGLISAVSPRVCLGIDAATFAASALSIGCFVRSRPAPRAHGGPHRPLAGIKVVWDEPRRRAILLMTVLGLFYIVPDGIAAPYAADLGRGPAVAGFLLAASGAGAVIGLPLFSRFVAVDRRPVALAITCVVAGLPLLLTLVRGGVYVAMILFAVTGALWSIQVVMSVSFLAELLPDNQRAQGMGVASSMNLTAQGLGVGLAGLLAQATSPVWAIALAGAASVPVALWPSVLWLKSVRAADGDPEPATGAPSESAGVYGGT
jgi:MFS family permease